MTSRNFEEGSAFEFARSYVLSTSLAEKREPPPPGLEFENVPEAADLRPGRPPELVLTDAKPKSMKLGAIVNPKKRAELVHKFWHHELQAAELMCWAILRFPEAPKEFLRGLLRVCRDEIRHMALYEEHLELLGFRIGDFPVRDWFWERVPLSESPLSFTAFVGMGLEAANLEHTERFATWFRTVGDERGAEIQDQVGREEVAHVRFATRWFKEWTGGVDFDEFCSALPPPMSPMLLKGKTLRRDLRMKAEMPEAFLDRLDAWQPSEKYSPPSSES
jgi:uncharacterized ferritin-like protein (DUF455 family)